MLKVNHVNIYYGRKKAVSDVSFAIHPGEIVGLIGPNGAGKTTIMKTLLGLTKFNGEISFNDQTISENNHKALGSVGALIEQPAIYPFLSGLQNLQLYSRDQNELNNLVKRLGMSSYIKQKSKGYSVGMKQKLGIALALLNHPQFVILDEPMNGLDVEATILIRQIIKEYSSNGTAFLISSHVLSELQKVMTSIIIINNGRVILNTSVDKFNQQSKSMLMFKTTNMAKSRQLLNNYLVPDKHNSSSLIIKNEDSITVQQLLSENQIWLTELKPFGLTFEQAIVDILRKRRGDKQ
ncbi:MAG: ATP-binding cassette domain-containing protein [Candidatus Limosilactobacillus merdavium]|uniref:ATP-binding cassette domain-containing protein n=1 Tax=Candidatus Limosilactobacillus merdavium TaxID=2838651 RepID=A0A9E2NUR1_9LACO|nr:ATP-binding cassette domain-containing protein [Candidatus Limosilactobacillus merdavium]